MYLRRLSIHGFKSFAAATELRFDSGITAIVGPNGTGKSNIVDALRWVIGEQRVRILRSDKMNSIIFNGSARRRPLGMAEVELTIENSRQVLPVEYTVITIGRRLYRSGEAEYLLNGTPCRLRDIQDLFTDTGMGAGAYSVIELKMIDEILSDKAQDRRRLFEEAAGLTKYKQRRSQAIRKLEITQADLARVLDLTDEISKRVASLKRQAATAARYRRYQERAQALDYTLLHLEREGLQTEEAAIGANLQRFEDELTRWISRTSRNEAGVESLRTALVAAEHTVGVSQKALSDNQTQVTRMEAELTLDQEKQSVIRRDLARLDQERAEDRQRVSGLADDGQRIRSALIDAGEAARTAEALLTDAGQKVSAARSQLQARQDALRQQRTQRQQYADSLSAHRRKLDRCESRITWLKEESGRLGREKQSVGTELAEMGIRHSEAGIRSQIVETALQMTGEKLEAAQLRHEELDDAVHEISRRLGELSQEAAGRAAEIEMLESLITSREDFPNAVRFLEEAGVAGRLRTVSDVITCAPEHRDMLDAALGRFGACIIVPTRREAAQALQSLKSHGQGRVLLAILNQVGRSAPSDSPPELPGRPLRDLIEVRSPDCAGLIDFLMHNIRCADSLDQAEHLLRADSGRQVRYVTPSGEWRDESGFLHGGGEAVGTLTVHLERRDTLELSRHELDRLHADIAELERQRKDLQLEMDDLDLAQLAVNVHEGEIKVQELRHNVRRLADDQARLEQQLAEVREQTRRVGHEIETQQSERQQLEQLLESVEADHTRARDIVKETDEVQMRLQRAALVAQDEYAARSVEAVACRAQCDALQRDLNRIGESEAELNRKKERRKKEGLLLEVRRATLSQEVEELKEQLENTRGQRPGLEQRFHADKDQIMGLRVELKGVEDRLRKLRREREAAQQRVTDCRMQHVAVQTRLTEVSRRVEECGESVSVVDEDFTQKEMRREREELDRKMQGMGRVNALALEEYEQEKQRLEFITGQCDDLQEAETTLNRTIAEINVAAKRRFSDVFGVVRENFQELFAELFGAGATCDLVLSQVEDVLESPIEIMAKPRGKRPVGITQLSSGEKTLTAIALLFAIYMVKPSPFCFLDEVDAPLDDANIDRYMRLIRRFADDTQFVLVTHNKRTMEMADRLYGVTMQEQGISSMVGVQFEQALAYAN